MKRNRQSMMRSFYYLVAHYPVGRCERMGGQTRRLRGGGPSEIALGLNGPDLAGEGA